MTVNRSMMFLIFAASLPLLSCSVSGLKMVSDFAPLRDGDSLEVMKSGAGIFEVISIERGERRVVFSQKGALYSQIENKNCIYVVDERLPKSIYSRQKVYLIQGELGKVFDLGLHVRAIIIGDYIITKKYYAEHVDGNVDLEIFSMAEDKFIGLISLGTLVTEYLGKDWYNLLSIDLTNGNGSLIVGFESEGTSYLDIQLDPKSGDYHVIHFWKDKK